MIQGIEAPHLLLRLFLIKKRIGVQSQRSQSQWMTDRWIGCRFLRGMGTYRWLDRKKRRRISLLQKTTQTVKRQLERYRQTIFFPFRLRRYRQTIGLFLSVFLENRRDNRRREAPRQSEEKLFRLLCLPLSRSSIRTREFRMSKHSEGSREIIIEIEHVND